MKSEHFRCALSQNGFMQISPNITSNNKKTHTQIFSPDKHASKKKKKEAFQHTYLYKYIYIIFKKCLLISKRLEMRLIKSLINISSSINTFPCYPLCNRDIGWFCLFFFFFFFFFFYCLLLTCIFAYFAIVFRASLSSSACHIVCMSFVA